jgi:DGQHR domain-containing protein
MISVPAMQLRQFGVTFYQAALGVRDVEKLVRFEVLSYSGGSVSQGKRPKKGRASKINWELLEQRIARSEEAYQRPVIQKKIAELTDYYIQCSESSTLPAIPGAVLLVADQRLSYVPISAHRVLGILQLPPHEGALRALDGQHRLLAMHQLSMQRPIEDVQIPAVIFDRLTADQVVELFVTINAKHTRLNPSHLISLSGRRLYPDRMLAISHDIIRSLDGDKSSALHGEIKLFGVGRGRVPQAPLAEELKSVFTALDAFGGRGAEEFRTNANRFFLNYFRQVARVFPRAWSGRRYSIKTAMALRAFLRVVPDVIATVKGQGGDPFEARALGAAIEPWGEYIGDARFETEGEWRQKLAGGSHGTVSILARELRSALRE